MPTKSDQPKRKLHRLSPAVYAATEYEFSFTVCARHQGTPFDNRQLADQVVESLLWTKSNYHWLLFCYCLMPDHLHFVCRLTDDDLKLMNAGARGIVPEGYSTIWAASRVSRLAHRGSWASRGKLWQKSSYDRVLDMEKPFEEIVEYVLNNPVRKGLVADWTEWPYAKIVDEWW